MAQGPELISETVDNGQIVYVLVDASGSMEEHKEDAEVVLTAVVDLLHPQGWASITFFGGDPGTESAFTCDSETIVEPARPQWTSAPDFPVLGRGEDKTAIGNAILAVLQESGGVATIIVITDGDEECDANFLEIRAQFPKAMFHVLKVGDLDVGSLHYLEASPTGTSGSWQRTPARPADIVIQGPFFSLISNDESWSTSGWDEAQNFLEKYLWVFCYSFFCGGTYFLSRSFQDQTEKVIEETRKWENYNREQAKTKQPSDDNLPEYLQRDAFEKEGNANKYRFAWMIGFAIIFSFPLAFLDDVPPKLVRYVPIGLVVGVGVVLGIRSLVSRAELEPQSTQEGTSVSKSRIPKWQRFVFVGGLIFSAILVGLFVDFDRARNAAWVPLSSGFAAALTILASTPFLFTGSRWWSLQREWHTYQIISDGVTRERVRRAAEEQRETQDQWVKLRSFIEGLSPSIPLSGGYLNRMRPGQRQAVEHKFDSVVGRLKTLLYLMGGNEASKRANERYEELFYGRRIQLRSLINSVIESSAVESAEELDLWRKLAAEVSTRFSNNGTEVAIRNLSRYLNRAKLADEE